MDSLPLSEKAQAAAVAVRLARQASSLASRELREAEINHDAKRTRQRDAEQALYQVEDTFYAALMEGFDAFDAIT